LTERERNERSDPLIIFLKVFLLLAVVCLLVVGLWHVCTILNNAQAWTCLRVGIGLIIYSGLRTLILRSTGVPARQHFLSRALIWVYLAAGGLALLVGVFALFL